MVYWALHCYTEAGHRCRIPLPQWSLSDALGAVPTPVPAGSGAVLITKCLQMAQGLFVVDKRRACRAARYPHPLADSF